jgi:hypothetical protein
MVFHSSGCIEIFTSQESDSVNSKGLIMPLENIDIYGILNDTRPLPSATNWVYSMVYSAHEFRLLKVEIPWTLRAVTTSLIAQETAR